MHPLTDPTMWSFSSWMSCIICFFICEWFLNLLSSLPIHWWGEGVGTVRKSQGEYLISILVSLFYRMVGRWVYTIKLSKLIRWNQHSLTSTPMDRNPQVAPHLQNSEQPAHQFRWTGIPTELRVRFGVKHNILYRQYLVRNLLCSTGNTLSLVEQDAVPEVGTGPLPSIHITTVTGRIGTGATSRWPPTPPREDLT